MRTKQDTLQIVQRLKEEYPLAECTLDYASAWLPAKVQKWCLPVIFSR